MANRTDLPQGYFSLLLHAHLPYVLHHGTWPHGLEWLLETAAETYLPLLRTIRRLSDDGIRLQANVSISPVLLEQLAHADFKAEFPHYLQRKIASAQEDAAFFQQAGELHLLWLARRWEQVFTLALDELHSLGGDLVAGFRVAAESGAVHLLTSAATHGYAPLLGTDESLTGQFKTAVSVHQKHFDRHPEGVWLPECGYRPAGRWQFPVPPYGRPEEAPKKRIGVETALSAAGLRFTFVDTHLIEDAEKSHKSEGALPVVGSLQSDKPSLYRPHCIGSSDVAVFARDPRSAFQVWSSRFGYPGDFAYLDFHKKRWPGGHRYWRVTGANLGMTDKHAYYPEAADERVQAHAEHFAGLLEETIRTQQKVGNVPLLLCAPFDLELFGHWWHEGMAFLEAVARVLAKREHGIEAITCAEYLDTYGAAGRLHLHEGSWGAGGDSSVWLNGETSSLLSRMYGAELAVLDAAGHSAWQDHGTGERIARQMCRELLMMESSDWPTLIATGAARDYAERRSDEHTTSFDSLHQVWKDFLADGAIGSAAEEVLAQLEQRDDLFPYVDPRNWIPLRQDSAT